MLSWIFSCYIHEIWKFLYVNNTSTIKLFRNKIHYAKSHNTFFTLFEETYINLWNILYKFINLEYWMVIAKTLLFLYYRYRQNTHTHTHTCTHTHTFGGQICEDFVFLNSKVFTKPFLFNSSTFLSLQILFASTLTWIILFTQNALSPLLPFDWQNTAEPFVQREC